MSTDHRLSYRNGACRSHSSPAFGSEWTSAACQNTPNISGLPLREFSVDREEPIRNSIWDSSLNRPVNNLGGVNGETGEFVRLREANALNQHG